MNGVEFRLLGPVGVWRDGDQLGPLNAQQRTLLAMLMLEPDRVIGVDRLVTALWSESPPVSARNAVQGHVSKLRRLLTGLPGVELATTGPGYRLVVDAQTVDLHRFRELVGRARDRDVTEAGELLRAALSLWQGPALLDVAGDWLPGIIGVGLEEERLCAVEERASADLRIGRHHDLVVELSAVVTAHPVRERTVCLLMTALERSGRRSDALALFRRTRRRLVEELGIEPGEDLRRLHQQVLEGEPDGSSQPDWPARGGARPRQLPADIAHFSGREQDIGALDGLISMTDQDPPPTAVIAVIGGPAGVGKTALAVHWAHRVADRFPDGQLFVNLRGFDPAGPEMAPAEALRHFLAALGVPARHLPADVETRATLFRTVVAERRILIVLDNARDVEQVRPLLPGAPGCLVLVNSRSQLSGLVAANGAHPFTLDRPSMKEAREFLRRRVGEQRVSAEHMAGEEIIERCARLPLALAIVAARAATNPGFSLAALAAELRESRGRLDAFESGDAATDVRTVFSWSYETLGDDAARLFRLLGLHPGPDFAVPAAASLAGVPVRRVRPLLAELTRVHLLQEHAPGRYTFHDLLRAYATELTQLTDSGADRRAALRGVLDHYLHTAYAADFLLQPSRDPLDLPTARPGTVPEHVGDEGRALAWFTAEHHILLAAVEQAAEHQFDVHAWQLAATLADFLDRQGHFSDQVAVQTTALRAAYRLAERNAEAHAHRALGRAWVRVGRDDEALSHLRQALDLLTALGDQIGQARTHLNLGWMFGQSDRSQEALVHVRRGLALYEATGNAAMQAHALNSLGWNQAHVGDYHEALASCRQALAMLERLRDHRGQAHTWDSLGYIYRQLGDQEQTVRCYQRSSEVARDDGDRVQQAEVLDTLGDAHHTWNAGDSARQAWLHALDLFDELGDPRADQVRAKLRTVAPAANRGTGYGHPVTGAPGAAERRRASEAG
ncbi:AfsR/SARP family transcriptional regulator [Plantactinospora endophytica]|uniref:SARP family transcriptional regulator n=1 Tax=Plantactinospora endophytica TaxID=673535 RepID=A0ABQ4EEG7_9ACTN|nr:BTAD domain-containing putative transcriptional regulator [Plantactinospora endophytica]GIG93116.1 SARP family transcriptional regulator [Plantactinospora endophytica]